ncbi:MAG TPA: DUF1398 family protein [Pedobacter sp.]
MFTEQQLKDAHSKVKTGADFPKYIQEIKSMGLISYEFRVKDGSIVYSGDRGYQVKGAAKYLPISIAGVSSVSMLEHTITIHQQGLTDFLTFCRQAADAGVEKWMIDTEKMLCTYYDMEGLEIVAEPIPG